MSQYFSKGALNKGFFLLSSQVLVFILLANMLASCGNSAPKQSVSVDSFNATKDNLNAQLSAAHMEIDGLTSKNVALDTQVMHLDSEIHKKDQEIGVLKGRIVYLEKNNKNLSGTLSKSVDNLKSQNNQLLSQKDSLLARYNNVKELGSILHASNIRLVAVHRKHNGLEKSTNSAWRADILRVYFDIDRNRIAEDGAKKLYIVIKDPDGNLLSNPDYGSGVTTNYKGALVNYSLLLKVPLKQNESVYDVTTDWEQNEPYKSGVYKVSIYNAGHKIGSGDVTLN